MRLKIFSRTIAVIALIFVFNSVSFSYSVGVSGKTKKHTTTGCGSCHSYGTGLTGFFSGPDTVIEGQTVEFKITLSRSGTNWRGGLDIASLRGAISPGAGSAYLKLLSNELVQNGAIIFSNSIEIPFNYTAPTGAIRDSLFATIAVNYTGQWNWVPEKKIIINPSSGISNENQKLSFNLGQNYPNPFNPSTSINFSLPKNGNVSLKIFSSTGRFILEAFNGYKTAGEHKINITLNKLSDIQIPSGVYFYVLESGRFRETRKMILLK